MYIIIAIVVCAVVAGAMKLGKSFKAKSVAKGDGLCNTCVNVHNVKGFGGKELVFCNYTSELRPIKFAVSDCTGYRDKNIAPVARVAGFVRIDEISPGEAFPAIVVRIAP